MRNFVFLVLIFLSSIPARAEITNPSDPEQWVSQVACDMTYQSDMAAVTTDHPYGSPNYLFEQCCGHASAGFGRCQCKCQGTSNDPAGPEICLGTECLVWKPILNACSELSQAATSSEGGVWFINGTYPEIPSPVNRFRVPVRVSALLSGQVIAEPMAIELVGRDSAWERIDVNVRVTAIERTGPKSIGVSYAVTAQGIVNPLSESNGRSYCGPLWGEVWLDSFGPGRSVTVTGAGNEQLGGEQLLHITSFTAGDSKSMTFQGLQFPASTLVPQVSDAAPSDAWITPLNGAYEELHATKILSGGDEIKTGPAGSAMVVLPSACLTVERNSFFFVPHLFRPGPTGLDTISLSRGQAEGFLFGSNPVEIRTPTARCRVMPVQQKEELPKFRVEYRDGTSQTCARVIAGRLSFASLSHPELQATIVEKGHELCTFGDAAPGTPAPWSP